MKLYKLRNKTNGLFACVYSPWGEWSSKGKKWNRLPYARAYKKHLLNCDANQALGENDLEIVEFELVEKAIVS